MTFRRIKQNRSNVTFELFNLHLYKNVTNRPFLIFTVFTLVSASGQVAMGQIKGVLAHVARSFCSRSQRGNRKKTGISEE